ncbi:43231_t:CDS:1, partial [Gigaspora margarita]
SKVPPKLQQTRPIMDKMLDTSYNTEESFNSINIDFEERKDNFKQSSQKFVTRYETVIDKQALQKEKEPL